MRILSVFCFVLAYSSRPKYQYTHYSRIGDMRNITFDDDIGISTHSKGVVRLPVGQSDFSTRQIAELTRQSPLNAISQRYVQKTLQYLKTLDFSETKEFEEAINNPTFRMSGTDYYSRQAAELILNHLKFKVI